MASAVARGYNGALGRCPQRGQGAEPWSGGQGAKPPEAESYLALKRPKKHIICYFCALCKLPRNPKKFH